MFAEFISLGLHAGSEYYIDRQDIQYFKVTNTVTTRAILIRFKRGYELAFNYTNVETLNAALKALVKGAKDALINS